MRPNQRLLIVDDDEDIAHFYSVMMAKNANFDVDIHLGRDLALLDEDWWLYNKYDAVILDLNMPIYSGLDVLKAIRKAEAKGYEVPEVLIVSANFRSATDIIKEDERAELMLKPFSPTEIITHIEKVLYERRD